MTRQEQGFRYPSQEPTRDAKKIITRVPHDYVARLHALHVDNLKVIKEIKDAHRDLFPAHHDPHHPTDLKFSHLPSRTEPHKPVK